MLSPLTSQISFDSKTLNLFCVSLHIEVIPNWIRDETRHAFEVLAPYMKNREQVLYIRDIPSLAIDDEYPGGHCYNQYEAMLALKSWNDDKRQIVATINHELHHMARWQNLGYGTTLGGAIVSEGLATFYEEVVSGWTPPWSKAQVADEALESIRKEWDNTDYNHRAWFFRGLYGRWVGYSIGYQLAQRIFKVGFDLTRSITIQPDEVRELLKHF
jgi:uncharacterized protein YjaZ